MKAKPKAPKAKKLPGVQRFAMKSDCGEWVYFRERRYAEASLLFTAGVKIHRMRLLPESELRALVAAAEGRTKE